MSDEIETASDSQIRSALQDASDKGKMTVVAMVCGVEEQNCWDILNSAGEIPLTDRILLSAGLE